jgi:hypothetical protein
LPVAETILCCWLRADSFLCSIFRNECLCSVDLSFLVSICSDFSVVCRMEGLLMRGRTILEADVQFYIFFFGLILGTSNSSFSFFLLKQSTISFLNFFIYFPFPLSEKRMSSFTSASLFCTMVLILKHF